jgi:hypothetical protein
MKKRGGSFSSFFVMNSWIIALVVLLLVVMNQFGMFEVLKKQPQRCDLGDAISCNAVYLSTESPDKISQGSINDTITFSIVNSLNEKIYNLRIVVLQCHADKNMMNNVSNGSVSFPPGENINYTLMMCHSLKPRARFSAEAIITYSTISENTTIDHISNGNFLAVVNAPESEYALKRIPKRIADSTSGFIKTRIG